MNIGIIGCGYVGMTNATVLAHKERILVWDKDKNILDDIINSKAPFYDKDIDRIIKEKKLSFSVCDNERELIELSDIILIALPTDYIEKNHSFDTSSIEKVVEIVKNIDQTNQKIILIRSTLPVGFSEKLKNKYNYNKIIYMPEFLREGMAFKDEIYSDRLVIGGEFDYASIIAEMYVSAIETAEGRIPQIQVTTTSEAESIKLFSNAYLAMRIAFFNELDTFAEKNGLDTATIIQGVCSDSRIGNNYNTPSFGYGGYCLPKDTLQLSECLQSDNLLIRSITESNRTRIKYIANNIVKHNGNIGIYRLLSKRGIAKIRNSVMLDIIDLVKKSKEKIYVYEPLINDSIVDERVEVVYSLEELNRVSDIIVANRMTPELVPYKNKVYTRDTFELEKYDD